MATAIAVIIIAEVSPIGEWNEFRANDYPAGTKLPFSSNLVIEMHKKLRSMFSATHKRVVVADDLTTVLSAVEALLRDSFDVVSMVSDGQAALEAILALKPDLAVMDISMPILSGIDVAMELKNRGSKTKIVFLTVHEDSDIIATCLSAGALGYVVKEVMNGDLILAMNEALAGRVFVSCRSS
jgi:DNA-binding NarL/FixJ family response regulator